MSQESGNPAERPGVTVFRPEKLANVAYDAETSRVIDLDTGNRLSVKSGHAGGPGQFGFSNQETGPIAGGSYSLWSSEDLIVYEITGLATSEPGFPTRGRSEFDSSPIAELFRARFDAVSPKHTRTVLVVDSRPETPGEPNRATGARSEGQ